MAIIVSRIRCGWLFILCVGAALFYLQPFAFSSFSMQTDWSGDRVMMCDPHCGNRVPAFLFSTTKCELNHIVQKVLDDPYDRNIICGQKSDRKDFFQEWTIRPSTLQVFLETIWKILAIYLRPRFHRQLFWVGWFAAFIYLFLNFPVTLMLTGDFPTGWMLGLVWVGLV